METEMSSGSPANPGPPPGKPSNPLRPDEERLFLHFFQVIAQFTQKKDDPDPLIAKITPEGIDAIIRNQDAAESRSHIRQLVSMGLVVLVALSGLGVICFLCVAFLAFRETEYIDALIAAAFAFLGGLGIGYNLPRKTGK
jgi:hypothetical protein